MQWSRPPNGLAIELVEGCTRRCSFCPLTYFPFPRNHVQSMSVKTAKKIAERIHEFIEQCEAWSPKVFFTLLGEPLLNPNFVLIAAIFRKALPQSQFVLISNGDLFQKYKNPYEEIFASVDIIVADAYTESAKEQIIRYGKEHNIPVENFYTEWAPKKKSPFTDHKRKIQNVICLMEDIATHDKESSTRKINNFGGNAPIQKKPLLLKKSCFTPLREMSIRYDGLVPLCCLDVGNEFILGNLIEQSIEDIWFQPALESARRLLRKGQRGFSPCCYCDARLPSTFFSVESATLDAPSAKDYRNIRSHFDQIQKIKTKNGRDRWVC